MTESAISEHQPKFIPFPVAGSGDHTSPIPAESTDPGLMNYSEGFPSGFSALRNEGGKSVSRADMNGILYDLSSLQYYFQYMGRNPWQEGHAYPVDAHVWHDYNEYVSAVNDNTSVPGTDDNWMLVTLTPYNDNPLWSKIDTLRAVVESYSATSGNLVRVDHLRFRKGMYDPSTGSDPQYVYLLPMVSQFPMYPFTCGGDTVKYMYQADKVNIVGCRFSLDDEGCTVYDSTYAGNNPKFFIWGPGYHNPDKSPGYNYNNNGGVMFRNRQVQNGSGYRYFVGYQTMSYTSDGNQGTHSSRGILGMGYNDVLTQKCSSFEVGGSLGVDYYRVTDYPSAGTNTENAVIRLAGLNCESNNFIQPYFCNAKAGQNGMSNAIYIGNMWTKNAAYWLQYIKIEEIFIGYLEKTIGSNSSNPGIIDTHLTKTYRILPICVVSGEYDDKCAWQLCSPDGTGIKVIGVTMGKGFSHYKWDGTNSLA